MVDEETNPETHGMHVVKGKTYFSVDFPKTWIIMIGIILLKTYDFVIFELK